MKRALIVLFIAIIAVVPVATVHFIYKYMEPAQQVSHFDTMLRLHQSR